MSTLAITIVNWNGKDMLGACLDSVFAQTYTDFTVYILDNGSTDGSVEFIRQNYPQVQLTVLEQNTGFASPHTRLMKNIFAANAQTQYVLTLNNDTQLESTFFAEMIACIERHENAASVQGKIMNFYERDLIDATGVQISFDLSGLNRGIHEKDTGQYSQEEEIFGPSASAALYKREALEHVALPNGDLFDSDYFAYYEDVDLAWRLRLAGYEAWYAPNAVAYHMHSATMKSHSPFKAFYIHRNHYFNMIKNLPLLFLIRALAFMPFRYLLLLSSLVRGKGASAELRKSIQKKPAAKSDIPQSMIRIVLRSWKEIVLALPALLRKRRSIQKKRQVHSQKVAKWFTLYKADLSKIIYGK